MRVDSKLRLGVIGFGYWGPNLVRNLAAMESDGVEVRSIAERDPVQREHIRSLYPDVRIVEDGSSIIADPQIDAVVIATPVSSHFPLARAAMEAGKHVFVEKPITASIREAAQLSRLAQDRDLVLMVGHVFEYTAAVRYIKDIIDSGELGEILYFRSLRVNLGIYRRDINVLWDLAPHDISIIQHVLGAVPDAVSAIGHAHITTGVPDIVNLNMDFGEARLATVVVSWLDPRKVREMTVIGTKKMLVYDDISATEKIRLYDKRVVGPPRYDSFGEFQYAYRYGDISTPMLEDFEPLREECRHFVDCVRRGIQPTSDGESGLRVVRTLAAAQLSLERSGLMVPLSDPGIEDVSGVIGSATNGEEP